MSSYMSTVQRRKTTKAKSKQAASEPTSTSTSAASGNSHTIATENERLQRNTLGDKLDALRKQQQHQQQKQHSTATSLITVTGQSRSTTSTPTSLCNGNVGSIGSISSIACCRDVNCRLNALQRLSLHGTGGAVIDERFTRELSVLAQQQQQQKLQRASVASNATTTSCVSNRSSSRSTCSPTTTATAGATHAALRDSSPDSGVSSDAAAAAANVFDNTTLRYISHRSAAPFERLLTLHLQIDLCAWLLFLLALFTRFYKLSTPPHVVFDEIHYGKYISLYLRNIFFFDQHPPLGKQLIAAVAHMAGYDGNYTFPRIGAEYAANVPIFWLRFVPALCGSALAPAVYKLLQAAHLSRWSSLLGGLLIVFDNALLTQSRFVLMESMLLLFITLGLYCMLKFQSSRFGSAIWIFFGMMAATCFTLATSVKYAGFLTYGLAAYLSCRFLWDQLYDATRTNLHIMLQAVGRIVLFTVLPLMLYICIFYVHLQTLQRAGPHDSIMTSAFQASLEGGLASITKGQPLKVVHGSQITLRHTHGRTCWLHSHTHVYPVRYPDKRGSSHQQQVTCYSFKDVNNWWIVKRPDREDLVVGDELDAIRHGDIIQLVHGITSRGLNSHDVAAPITPQCQEVSCYIDYEIKMPGELLWRVEILNRDTEGPIWHAIKSEVRLIHHTTNAALRYSGRQLPEWGFNQHEVVADRVIEHKDSIWNVEEHRYTKTQDQRERERQLLKAEMIPTKKIKLSFWAKFLELQTKMLWTSKQLQGHMYSSTPLEWPLLDKGIAYWVDSNSNSQIHLLGNVLIWYSATAALLLYTALNIFYVLRRHRLSYDLPPNEWQRFRDVGDLFYIGYLLHYLPYFAVERALFLHHYLPAFLFKLLLLCYMVEHVDYLLRLLCNGRLEILSAHRAVHIVRFYRLGVLVWLIAVVSTFAKFLPLSFGIHEISTQEIINLRWKDTWDFILQRDFNLAQQL